MIPITVNYTATDNCSVGCVLTVTSNEPINGLGDGDTAPDWQVVDAHHVTLRSERSGKGTGRVYTITVTCTDPAGHSVVRTTTVVVSKSQAKTGIGVDSTNPLGTPASEGTTPGASTSTPSGAWGVHGAIVYLPSLSTPDNESRRTGQNKASRKKKRARNISAH
jgi:hypothetical protein